MIKIKVKKTDVYTRSHTFEDFVRIVLFGLRLSLGINRESPIEDYKVNNDQLKGMVLDEDCSLCRGQS